MNNAGSAAYDSIPNGFRHSLDDSDHDAMSDLSEK